MIEFEWPWLLALFPLPWLLRALLPAAADHHEAALRVPYIEDFEQSLQAVKRRHGRRWPWLLYFVAWLCLLLAAARPQWTGDEIELPVSGRDLMLAIDLSGSMGQDFSHRFRTVSKLDATKAVAGDFIERRVGDRIGLILFGQQAFVQSPLTFDRATVRTLLNEAVVNLAGQATAIGDAIGLAVKRAGAQTSDSRHAGQQHVLILLTDGVNNAGALKPEKAAELAAGRGMKIYTIGIGNRFSRDLNEAALRQVASITGARYFRAHNMEELEQIYALLDQLEPLEKETRSYRPTWSLYYWPLTVAIVMAALLGLLRWRGLA